MKLLKKELLNEKERLIYLLGTKILYSKEKIENNKIKYSINIGKIKLDFNKKLRTRKKNKPLKFDKMQQMYALIFAKNLRSFFRKNDNATTLVLGSSTARCSFIEDEYSINMSTDAQDLYYSYQIFEKFGYQMPNLKNLIIYYDVFTSGNDLDVSMMQFSTAYYKVFMDIPYKNKLNVIQKNILDFENILRKSGKFINKKINDIDENIMLIQHGGMQTNEELRNWAKAELKLAYKTNMLKYLSLLLNRTKDLNVYIILAPRHPIALDVYPQVSELYKDLYDLIQEKNNQNIKIVNCFDKFEKDEFVDLLHLNSKGAEKITKMIKDAI